MAGTFAPRRLLATLTSVISGIGGHFVNGRSDRALFFLALLLLWPALMWLGAMIAFQGESGRISGWLVFVVASPALAWVATWLASVVVTYVDGGKGIGHVPARGVLGMLGAVVLSGICLLLMFAASSLLAFLPPLLLHTLPSFSYGREEARPESPLPHSENFWQYLHFGGEVRGSGRLPPPPGGSAQVVGKFVYADKPAPNVTVQVMLNGAYESEPVVTDADGLFALKLPPGSWYINRLRTTSWKGMPDRGDFVLVSGHEPKLGVAPYFARPVVRGERGLHVMAVEGVPQASVTFTIRRAVELQWPSPGATPTKTTVSAGVVRWTPYPEAKKYIVTLSDTERRQGGATYRPVVYKTVVGDTQLPLSLLKASPQEGKTKEYSVAVAAFAEDGTFLSEIRSPGGASFILGDSHVFLDERLAQLEISERDVNEIFENRPRLAAVEALIKENMLVEAERLLTKVKGATEPGRKEALHGFLLARRGQCREAEQWFAKARAAGEDCCIVDVYRKGCDKR